MSAFVISAAAPAVAPAKARVARTGIKARRAAPVRRSVRAAATAEASADTAASASEVRHYFISGGSYAVSTRIGPASRRASIDHRDRRSSGVVFSPVGPLLRDTRKSRAGRMNRRRDARDAPRSRDRRYEADAPRFFVSTD